VTVSSRARTALFAQQTDEVFLPLLTITHASLATPIRVVHNPQNITSRGNLFVGYPFEMELPPQDPDQPPRLRIAIDNIDRDIVASLRALSTPPSVTLEVVLAATPDTVEAGPFVMTLTGVDYDALTVTGDLAAEDVLSEPYPGDSFTPAKFPGLF
jgi:hypothetical protein